MTVGVNHSSHRHRKTSNIKIAFVLNLIFTVAEIIGGVWTNSLAILSDALHDLGDTFSLGLGWYFERLSGKKRTIAFSYGYKRFSLLGAFINSIVLITGSFFILSAAIPRLLNPEHSNAKGMLAFAIVGIVVNGIAALRVKGGKTLNERVITWHLLEDVLGWIAVLIASVVMLVQDVHILDPILSIVITLYVLWNVVKNFKKTVMVFLQGVPDSFKIAEVENKITSLSHIKKIHDTHIWTLDGENHILTTHVVVPQNISDEDQARIKCSVREKMLSLGINHVTVEIECEGENCAFKKC